MDKLEVQTGEGTITITVERNWVVLDLPPPGYRGPIDNCIHTLTRDEASDLAHALVQRLEGGIGPYTPGRGG